MMRIITGKARGTKLLAPEGTETRPTAERTKEAIFSMIQFDICNANVLDLFAGSGQLGLEALSRGAKTCLFCDASKSAMEIIKKNIVKTHFEEVTSTFSGDYLAALRIGCKGKSFDIVFLDPPYAMGAVPKALESLTALHLLSDNATVICETGDAKDVFFQKEVLANDFEVIKETKYGVAHVTILKFRGSL